MSLIHMIYFFAIIWTCTAGATRLSPFVWYNWYGVFEEMWCKKLSSFGKLSMCLLNYFDHLDCRHPLKIGNNFWQARSIDITCILMYFSCKWACVSHFLANKCTKVQWDNSCSLTAGYMPLLGVSLSLTIYSFNME